MKILSQKEKAMLWAISGQLADLKNGNLKEIIVKKDENAELLAQVVQERLEIEEEAKQAEALDDLENSQDREFEPMSPKDFESFYVE
jgi:transcription antitermination factor NusA-like protein